MHLPLSGGVIATRGPQFLDVTFEGCYFQVVFTFKTLWHCNTSDYFCVNKNKSPNRKSILYNIHAWAVFSLSF